MVEEARSLRAGRTAAAARSAAAPDAGGPAAAE